MKTETIKIKDLRPYEKNARKHEAADVAAIAKSIEAFGFRDPVGVWGPNNIIVEGHGRVLAAKQLGMTEVPCIRLDDLTDEQRRAYALAHNKTAELSSWDMKILPAELSDIHGLDMSSFGFIPPAETGTEDDYQEPDQTKEPNARRGQLWLLGEHRLLCGDATDPEDMRRLMAGDQADLLVTDPPYNINYTGDTKEHLKIINDSMSSERFRKFLTDAFRNAVSAMRPGAAFYIWHAHMESVNFSKPRRMPACRSASCWSGQSRFFLSAVKTTNGSTSPACTGGKTAPRTTSSTTAPRRPSTRTRGRTSAT